jgi:hypothetical protein
MESNPKPSSRVKIAQQEETGLIGLGDAAELAAVGAVTDLEAEQCQVGAAGRLPGPAGARGFDRDRIISVDDIPNTAAGAGAITVAVAAAPRRSARGLPVCAVQFDPPRGRYHGADFRRGAARARSFDRGDGSPGNGGVE